MLDADAFLSAPNDARIRALEREAPRRAFRAERLERGLTVVILNLNRPDLIVPQLRSLSRARAEFARDGYALQILVGDTGSVDHQTLSVYDELSDDGVETERNLQYHFSACNNRLAFERARTDALLFLNNDVIAPASDSPGPYLRLRRELDANPELGAVGALLWFGEGPVQHAGVGFVPAGARRGLPFHLMAGERAPPEKFPDRAAVAAVTGACLMMPSTLFARVGGFDEAYSAEFQDVDLCLRAHRLGRPIRALNVGRLVHLENATRPKGESNAADRALFRRRWSAYIKAFCL